MTVCVEMPLANDLQVVTCRELGPIRAVLGAECATLDLDAYRLAEALDRGMGFLAALHRGTPVGILAYQWEDGALQVVSVRERAGFEGKGAATRLIQAAGKIGFALGARHVALEHQPDALRELLAGPRPEGAERRASTRPRPRWLWGRSTPKAPVERPRVAVASG